MNRLICCLLCIVAAGPLFGQDQSAFDKYSVNSLFNKNVQRELELVEDQSNEISQSLKRLTEFRDGLSAKLQQLRDDGAGQEELEDYRAKLIEELNVEKKRIGDEMFRILLPHQATRLREISAQLANREAMKKSKTSTGLLTEEMVEYLGIESDQAQRIKERSEEIRQELTKKIKKLTDKAVEELLQELTPEQREKYQQLMGQRFVE